MRYWAVFIFITVFTALALVFAAKEWPSAAPAPVVHTAKDRQQYALNLATVQSSMGRPSTAHATGVNGTTLVIETDDATEMAYAFRGDPILRVMHDQGFKKLLITDTRGMKYNANLE